MRTIGPRQLMWLAMVISLVIGAFFFDQLNLNWMLFLYVVGAIIVGIVIYIGEFEPTFGQSKQVRPDSWGLYANTNSQLPDIKSPAQLPKV